MATKKQTFVVKGETVSHIHLDELPRKIIRKGSDTEKYRNEVLRTLLTLQYTYNQIVLSAQVCYVNIDSISSTKPYMPGVRDIYDSVQAFVYHYENYALRTYILREKVSLFINAALNVGWPPGDVRISTMLNHSTVKQAKLDKVLKIFDPNQNTALGDLIKNRTQLTHKLYYPKTDHYLRPIVEFKDEEEIDQKEWYREWKRKIKDKEDVVANAVRELMDINHQLSEKIYLFHEKK